MATNGNTLAVYVTESIDCVYCCFCIVDQLRDEVVIRLGLAFTNNGEGSIIKYGLTARYPIDEGGRAWESKLVFIMLALAS